MDDSVLSLERAPYAGLLVIPPAMINPLCNGCFFFVRLHNAQPHMIAVMVIRIPYRMDLTSNDMFWDPVENPVPAKNSANPKFLKALRHCDEI